MNQTATPTPERLLDATWACVARDGLAATTSRAIAEEADANLGAITYYFGSKDALVAEAFVRAIRELVAPAVDALSDDELDETERFLAAITRLQAGLDAEADRAPAYLEALLHAPRSPAVATAAAEIFGELRALLATTMRRQQDDGFLPPWVDAEVMAGLLIAVAQGVVLQSIVDPSGPPPSAMAAQLAQILLAARTG